MTVKVRGWTAGLALGLLSVVSGALAAESTVKVTLWDKGPQSVMMDQAHMQMMGRMQMAGGMTMMGIDVDKATVPAGWVTFDVTNASKDIIHEMILAPLTADETELPYVADENRIDEEKAGYLGEVSELDAGKGGSLKVELKPGKYILFCNIPGHFISGMWTVLTVGS